MDHNLRNAPTAEPVFFDFVPSELFSIQLKSAFQSWAQQTQNRPLLSMPILMTFVEMYESFHLIMLPPELIERILDFLDKKSIISAFSKTCKYCRVFCSKNGYDQLFLFCREGQKPQDLNYSQRIKDEIRELCPLLNSQVSLEWAQKPSDILVHVFTRNNTKIYAFAYVISMIVELCNRRNPSEKIPNISGQVDPLKGILGVPNQADISNETVDVPNQADPSGKTPNTLGQVNSLKDTLDVSNRADVSKEIASVPNQAGPSKVALDDVSEFVDDLLREELCSLQILKLSGLKINESIANKLGNLELIVLDLQNCYHVDMLFRPDRHLLSRAVFLNVSETSFKNNSKTSFKNNSETSFKNDPAKLVFGEHLEGLSISISGSFLERDFIIDASQCCKINVM